MRADVLILGQGLAGTLLGWELERAGISFEVADPGHERAATMAAAGIINPVTGRRLVKSWRIDALLPAARKVYGEMAETLGVRLWREMRVRRLYADAREREVAVAKVAKGELEPFVTNADEDGIWITDAVRVELGTLLASARQRWKAMGWLRECAVQPTDVTGDHAWVIDCRGRAAAEAAEWAFVPWEFSKGEMLELAVDGLAPDVVLNRRHWIVPVRAGVAWVGATHEPGVCDAQPSEAARALLERSTRELLGRERTFTVTGHRAGVRVNLPDKRPLAGRHPVQSRLGVINGLGAKGALWAPFLARQWARHLADGAAFDSEVAVSRFGR